MPAGELDCLLDEYGPVDQFAVISDAAKALEAKIDLLQKQYAKMSVVLFAKPNAVDETLARGLQPHHPLVCIFCPNEKNCNEHVSGRCRNYTNIISRTIQVAALLICDRCLLPRHEVPCETKCSRCNREHNVLLCPLRNAESPVKRRKPVC